MDVNDVFVVFSLLSTLQWNNLHLKYCCLAVGERGCSQLFDILRRYCGASINNMNNAIVVVHSSLEWPKVNAPTAQGPLGPRAAGTSTEGHSGL